MRVGLAVMLLSAALGPPLAGQDFRVADSIVESGIRQGLYPGAVLAVGGRAGVRHARGFGRLTWSAGAPEASPDSTLWDLASLTKVVGTTALAAHLVEQHRLDLDAAVASYLPRFVGEGKRQVTVRMLLDHTSGLPSYVEFFRMAPDRDSAVTLLYQTPLRRSPGLTAEYSDLNFMLLGLLVERITGEPLEQAVVRTIFLPAGMRLTSYRPAAAFSRRTAPTGRWRGHPICCHVNDQNAARFGEVAGHAGLFSTAGDLARYARLWLDLGTLDGHRILDSTTVRTFLTPAAPEATRLLGWERPDPTRPEDSAYGQRLSASAYGHTGWTGTLLWIDPERDLFLVLLTNRSYAPRVGQSIRRLRALRGALADAVVEVVDAVR